MTTTIVTTCKGRVSHLEISVASWLYVTPCPIVIVTDGCPEMTPAFRTALWDPDHRVRIIETGAAPSEHFSKPRALNLGAVHAGTEDLLFLDADTLLFSAFWDWYVKRVTLDALFIVPPSPERKDLTGILGVARCEYLVVGGADGGMVGWGSEDLDLRLRLYLARKLRVIDIPPEFVASIPHDDLRRTRYYAEQDKMASHQRNLQRLVNNAEALTGQSIWSLLSDPTVKRMFGSGFGPSTDTATLKGTPDDTR